MVSTTTKTVKSAAESVPAFDVAAGSLSVFRMPEKGKIFVPPSGALKLRFNCKDGALARSQKDMLADSGEIAVLATRSYFGNLGKTECEHWLQFFYVAAPSDTKIPQDCLIVSYLKTQGLKNLFEQVDFVTAQRINPALGIFEFSFQNHDGRNGAYYSVEWKWRERQMGEFNDSAEAKQLQQIIEFMGTSPSFVDEDGTRNMICLDGLTTDEADQAITGFIADFDAAEAARIEELETKKSTRRR